MPELPEVETLVRGLRTALKKRTILAVKVRIPRLRAPLKARKLSALISHGKVISVIRRAKFIVITFKTQHVLVIHLGMTGSLRIEKLTTKNQKHDHVIFTLTKNEKLIYNDPRRFGLVQAFKHQTEFAAHYAHLGIEPLTPKFTAEWLWQKTRQVNSEIKPYLMNAEIVVGVGNIYASESLHQARLAPTRRAKNLTRTECATLVRNIKKVLIASIKSGGTTISDYYQLSGKEGAFVHKLQTYNRATQKCRRAKCRGIITKITQAGRSTFYCPHCQK